MQSTGSMQNFFQNQSFMRRIRSSYENLLLQGENYRDSGNGILSGLNLAMQNLSAENLN
jgi:hypothetical protein